MKFSRAPRRRLGLVALLVAGRAVAVLGIHAFRQKLESFQPLGFEPVGERRTAGSSARSRRRRRRAISAPATASCWSTASKPARIDDLRRLLGAARRVADRRAARRSARDPSPTSGRRSTSTSPGSRSRCSACVYLAIGLYTVWRTEEGTLFLLWCLASAVLYVYSPVFPIDRLGAWVYLGDELARIFLPPLTLHLFLSIPRSRTPEARGAALAALRCRRRRSPRCRSTSSSSTARSSLGRPTAALLQRLDRLELVHLALFAAALDRVLARRLRAADDWEQHRQLLWLLVGTATGYAPVLPALRPSRSSADLRPGESLDHARGAAAGRRAARLRLGDPALPPLGSRPDRPQRARPRADPPRRRRRLRAVRPRAAAQRAGAPLASCATCSTLLRRRRRSSASSFRPIAGIQGALERLHYGRVFRRRRGPRLARPGAAARARPRPALRGAARRARAEPRARPRQPLPRPAQRPRRGAPRGRPAGDRSRSTSCCRASGATASRRSRRSPCPGEADDGRAAALSSPATATSFRSSCATRASGSLLCGLRGDAQPLNSEDIDLVRVLLDQAALAIENAQLLDQVQRQLDQVGALQRHSEGILESSPAGIAVLEPDGSIVMANLAFAALAGRPARRAASAGSSREVLRARPAAARRRRARSRARRPSTRSARLRALEVSLARAAAGGRRRPQRPGASRTSASAWRWRARSRRRTASPRSACSPPASRTRSTRRSPASPPTPRCCSPRPTPDDPRRELLEKVEKQTFRASRIVVEPARVRAQAGRRAQARRPRGAGRRDRRPAARAHERASGVRLELDSARPAARASRPAKASCSRCSPT